MMNEELFPQIEFEFVGGDLCLDFINTQISDQGRAVELLIDFQHLVAWLVQAGLFEAAEGQKALQSWGNSTEGEQVLAQARAFRQTLREMVETIINKGEVEPHAIEAINRLLKVRSGYLQLVAQEKGFRTLFVNVAEAPLHLLAPVAESAAHLLATADLSLLKRCGNPECVRYFYDNTKNHSRRWCSMDTCGNRTKVAAYYARKRGSAS